MRMGPIIGLCLFLLAAGGAIDTHHEYSNRIRREMSVSLAESSLEPGVLDHQDNTVKDKRCRSRGYILGSTHEKLLARKQEKLNRLCKYCLNSPIRMKLKICAKCSENSPKYAPTGTLLLPTNKNLRINLQNVETQEENPLVSIPSPVTKIGNSWEIKENEDNLDQKTFKGTKDTNENQRNNVKIGKDGKVKPLKEDLENGKQLGNTLNLQYLHSTNGKQNSFDDLTKIEKNLGTSLDETHQNKILSHEKTLINGLNKEDNLQEANLGSHLQNKIQKQHPTLKGIIQSLHHLLDENYEKSFPKTDHKILKPLYTHLKPHGHHLAHNLHKNKLRVNNLNVNHGLNSLHQNHLHLNNGRKPFNLNHDRLILGNAQNKEETTTEVKEELDRLYKEIQKAQEIGDIEKIDKITDIYDKTEEQKVDGNTKDNDGISKIDKVIKNRINQVEDTQILDNTKHPNKFKDVEQLENFKTGKMKTSNEINNKSKQPDTENVQQTYDGEIKTNNEEGYEPNNIAEGSNTEKVAQTKDETIINNKQYKEPEYGINYEKNTKAGQKIYEFTGKESDTYLNKDVKKIAKNFKNEQPKINIIKDANLRQKAYEFNKESNDTESDNKETAEKRKYENPANTDELQNMYNYELKNNNNSPDMINKNKNTVEIKNKKPSNIEVQQKEYNKNYNMRGNKQVDTGNIDDNKKLIQTGANKNKASNMEYGQQNINNNYEHIDKENSDTTKYGNRPDSSQNIIDESAIKDKLGSIKNKFDSATNYQNINEEMRDSYDSKLQEFQKLQEEISALEATLRDTDSVLEDTNLLNFNNEPEETRLKNLKQSHKEVTNFNQPQNKELKNKFDTRNTDVTFENSRYGTQNFGHKSTNLEQNFANVKQLQNQNLENFEEDFEEDPNFKKEKLTTYNFLKDPESVAKNLNLKNLKNQDLEINTYLPKEPSNILNENNLVTNNMRTTSNQVNKPNSNFAANENNYETRLESSHANLIKQNLPAQTLPNNYAPDNKQDTNIKNIYSTKQINRKGNIYNNANLEKGQNLKFSAKINNPIPPDMSQINTIKNNNFDNSGNIENETNLKLGVKINEQASKNMDIQNNNDKELKNSPLDKTKTTNFDKENIQKTNTSNFIIYNLNSDNSQAANNDLGPKQIDAQNLKFTNTQNEEKNAPNNNEIYINSRDKLNSNNLISRNDNLGMNSNFDSLAEQNKTEKREKEAKLNGKENGQDNNLAKLNTTEEQTKKKTRDTKSQIINENKPTYKQNSAQEWSMSMPNNYNSNLYSEKSNWQKSQQETLLPLYNEPNIESSIIDDQSLKINLAPLSFDSKFLDSLHKKTNDHNEKTVPFHVPNETNPTITKEEQDTNIMPENKNFDKTLFKLNSMNGAAISGKEMETNSKKLKGNVHQKIYNLINSRDKNVSRDNIQTKKKMEDKKKNLSARRQLQMLNKKMNITHLLANDISKESSNSENSNESYLIANFRKNEHLETPSTQIENHNPDTKTDAAFLNNKRFDVNQLFEDNYKNIPNSDFLKTDNDNFLQHPDIDTQNLDVLPQNGNIPRVQSPKTISIFNNSPQKVNGYKSDIFLPLPTQEKSFPLDENKETTIYHSHYQLNPKISLDQPKSDFLTLTKRSAEQNIRSFQTRDINLEKLKEYSNGKGEIKIDNQDAEKIKRVEEKISKLTPQNVRVSSKQNLLLRQNNMSEQRKKIIEELEARKRLLREKICETNQRYARLNPSVCESKLGAQKEENLSTTESIITNVASHIKDDFNQIKDASKIMVSENVLPYVEEKLIDLKTPENTLKKQKSVENKNPNSPSVFSKISTDLKSGIQNLIKEEKNLISEKYKNAKNYFTENGSKLKNNLIDNVVAKIHQNDELDLRNAKEMETTTFLPVSQNLTAPIQSQNIKTLNNNQNLKLNDETQHATVLTNDLEIANQHKNIEHGLKNADIYSLPSKGDINKIKNLKQVAKDLNKFDQDFGKSLQEINTNIKHDLKKLDVKNVFAKTLPKSDAKISLFDPIIELKMDQKLFKKNQNELGDTNIKLGHSGLNINPNSINNYKSNLKTDSQNLGEKTGASSSGASINTVITEPKTNILDSLGVSRQDTQINLGAQNHLGAQIDSNQLGAHIVTVPKINFESQLLGVSKESKIDAQNTQNELGAPILNTNKLGAQIVTEPKNNYAVDVGTNKYGQLLGESHIDEFERPKMYLHAKDLNLGPNKNNNAHTFGQGDLTNLGQVSGSQQNAKEEFTVINKLHNFEDDISKILNKENLEHNGKIKEILAQKKNGKLTADNLRNKVQIDKLIAKENKEHSQKIQEILQENQNLHNTLGNQKLGNPINGLDLKVPQDSNTAPNSLLGSILDHKLQNEDFRSLTDPDFVKQLSHNPHNKFDRVGISKLEQNQKQIKNSEHDISKINKVQNIEKSGATKDYNSQNIGESQLNLDHIAQNIEQNHNQNSQNIFDSVPNQNKGTSNLNYHQNAQNIYTTKSNQQNLENVASENNQNINAKNSFAPEIENSENVGAPLTLTQLKLKNNLLAQKAKLEARKIALKNQLNAKTPHSHKNLLAKNKENIALPKINALKSDISKPRIHFPLNNNVDLKHLNQKLGAKVAQHETLQEAIDRVFGKNPKLGSQNLEQNDDAQKTQNVLHNAYASPDLGDSTNNDQNILQDMKGTIAQNVLQNVNEQDGAKISQNVLQHAKVGTNLAQNVLQNIRHDSVKGAKSAHNIMTHINDGTNVAQNVLQNLQEHDDSARKSHSLLGHMNHGINAQNSAKIDETVLEHLTGNTNIDQNILQINNDINGAKTGQNILEHMSVGTNIAQNVPQTSHITKNIEPNSGRNITQDILGQVKDGTVITQNVLQKLHLTKNDKLSSGAKIAQNSLGLVNDRVDIGQNRNSGTKITQNILAHVNDGTNIAQNALQKLHLSKNVEPGNGIKIAQNTLEHVDDGTNIAQNAVQKLYLNKNIEPDSGAKITQNTLGRLNDGTNIAQNVLQNLHSKYNGILNKPKKAQILAETNTAQNVLNNVAHENAFKSAKNSQNDLGPIRGSSIAQNILQNLRLKNAQNNLERANKKDDIEQNAFQQIHRNQESAKNVLQNNPSNTQNNPNLLNSRIDLIKARAQKGIQNILGHINEGSDLAQNVGQNVFDSINSHNPNLKGSKTAPNILQNVVQHVKAGTNALNLKNKGTTIVGDAQKIAPEQNIASEALEKIDSGTKATEHIAQNVFHQITENDDPGSAKHTQKAFQNVLENVKEGTNIAQNLLHHQDQNSQLLNLGGAVTGHIGQNVFQSIDSSKTAATDASKATQNEFHVLHQVKDDADKLTSLNLLKDVDILGNAQIDTKNKQTVQNPRNFPTNSNKDLDVSKTVQKEDTRQHFQKVLGAQNTQIGAMNTIYQNNAFEETNDLQTVAQKPSFINEIPKTGILAKSVQDPNKFENEISGPQIITQKEPTSRKDNVGEPQSQTFEKSTLDSDTQTVIKQPEGLQQSSGSKNIPNLNENELQNNVNSKTGFESINSEISKPIPTKSKLPDLKTRLLKILQKPQSSTGLLQKQGNEKVRNEKLKNIRDEILSAIHEPYYRYEMCNQNLGKANDNPDLTNDDNLLSDVNTKINDPQNREQKNEIISNNQKDNKSEAKTNNARNDGENEPNKLQEIFFKKNPTDIKFQKETGNEEIFEKALGDPKQELTLPMSIDSQTGAKSLTQPKLSDDQTVAEAEPKKLTNKEDSLKHPAVENSQNGENIGTKTPISHAKDLQEDEITNASKPVVGQPKDLQGSRNSQTAVIETPKSNIRNKTSGSEPLIVQPKGLKDSSDNQRVTKEEPKNNIEGEKSSGSEPLIVQPKELQNSSDNQRYEEETNGNLKNESSSGSEPLIVQPKELDSSDNQTVSSIDYQDSTKPSTVNVNNESREIQPTTESTTTTSSTKTADKNNLQNIIAEDGVLDNYLDQIDLTDVFQNNSSNNQNITSPSTTPSTGEQNVGNSHQNMFNSFGSPKTQLSPTNSDGASQKQNLQLLETSKGNNRPQNLTFPFKDASYQLPNSQKQDSTLQKALSTQNLPKNENRHIEQPKPSQLIPKELVALPFTPQNANIESKLAQNVLSNQENLGLANAREFKTGSKNTLGAAKNELPNINNKENLEPQNDIHNSQNGARNILNTPQNVPKNLFNNLGNKNINNNPKNFQLGPENSINPYNVHQISDIPAPIGAHTTLGAPKNDLQVPGNINRPDIQNLGAKNIFNSPNNFDVDTQTALGPAKSNLQAPDNINTQGIQNLDAKNIFTSPNNFDIGTQTALGAPKSDLQVPENINRPNVQNLGAKNFFNNPNNFEIGSQTTLDAPKNVPQIPENLSRQDLQNLGAENPLSAPENVEVDAQNALDSPKNVPEHYKKLMNHKIYIMGDGIKIPLALKQTQDGGLQMVLDIDKMCEEKCRNSGNSVHDPKNCNCPCHDQSQENIVGVKQNVELPKNFTKNDDSKELYDYLKDLSDKELKKLTSKAVDNQLKQLNHIPHSSLEQSRQEIVNLLSEYEELYEYLKNLEERDLHELIKESNIKTFKEETKPSERKGRHLVSYEINNSENKYNDSGIIIAFMAKEILNNRNNYNQIIDSSFVENFNNKIPKEEVDQIKEAVKNGNRENINKYKILNDLLQWMEKTEMYKR